MVASPPVVAVHRVAAQEPGALVGISRDGRLVAFIRWTTRSSYRVGVIDMKTRRARLLATGDGDPFAPALSPDGRWLVFVRRRTLFSMSSEGGPVHRLTRIFSSGLSWLADGRVAAHIVRGAVSAISLNGRRKTVLVRRVSANATVSPNGRYVLDPAGCRVRLIDIARGTSRAVARSDLGGYGAGGALWSPDSRHYALRFGQWDDDCRQFQSFPGGGVAVPGALRLAAGWPLWSTDGRYLFVIGGVTGTAVTYLQPLRVLDMRTRRLETVFANRVQDVLAGPQGLLVFGRYDKTATPPDQGPLAPLRLYTATLRR
jgi:hypothetical protein